MIVVDMLMKVMSHEIGTLQYINQHSDFNFTNICKLHEILESEEKLVLVLDYCEGGQIMKWDYKTHSFTPSSNAEMSESTIRELLSGICKGLSLLHRIGVLHRDIKPQNILLKNGVPMIADFGISKVIE